MSTYVQKLYPDHYTAMNQGLKALSQHSYIQDSTWLFEAIKETKWTTEENKLFESALALFDKETPDRWYNVAAMIPGKTVNDVIKQYRELEDDVSDIEAGLVPVPGYGSDCVAVDWTNNQRVVEGMNLFYIPGGKRNSFPRPNEHERKKGVPWTEDEHRQFLLGLKKYGKGDWRNISRNFVTSRTPTQVASHAQKYFIRQVSGGKDKRRSSIHDITTVNLFDAKPTSPDDIKPPTPDNCSANLQQPQQRPNMIGMCKTLYDWKVPNQGSVMAFNMPNSSQLMAPLRGVSTYGLQMQDKYIHKSIVDGSLSVCYSSVSQMKSSGNSS